jgi:Tfp pilus assembly major pilin PilA
MKRPMLLVIAVIALSAALAAGALAALPKKGGLYEGTLYASGTAAITKEVRIKVAPNGKTARVTWFCGVGRAQSTLQFAIKPDGTFKAFSNTGKLTVWSFVGRFASATRARAVLHLNATCDGKGGTLNLNAKL